MKSKQFLEYYVTMIEAVDGWVATVVLEEDELSLLSADKLLKMHDKVDAFISKHAAKNGTYVYRTIRKVCFLDGRVN